MDTNVHICLLLYDILTYAQFCCYQCDNNVITVINVITVKSFPRQSRSRGGGIATVYKSTLGSNITFKTNFDFTHTSFEVVQASITLQHNTLHFFCL